MSSATATTASASRSIAAHLPPGMSTSPGEQRGDHHEARRDRPHQRLPVRMQNCDRLLAHRERAVMTHEDMVGPRPPEGRACRDIPARAARTSRSNSPGADVDDVARRDGRDRQLPGPLRDQQPAARRRCQWRRRSARRPSGSSTRTVRPRVAHSARYASSRPDRSGSGSARNAAYQRSSSVEHASSRSSRDTVAPSASSEVARRGRTAETGSSLRRGGDVEAGADHHRRPVGRLLGEDARQLAVADQHVVRPLEHRVDARSPTARRTPPRPRSAASASRAAPRARSRAAAARRRSATRQARSTRTGRACRAPRSAPPRRAPAPRDWPGPRRPARAGRRWSSRCSPRRRAPSTCHGGGEAEPAHRSGYRPLPSSPGSVRGRSVAASRRSRCAAGGSPCPCSPP